MHDLLDELKTRGCIHDASNFEALQKLLQEQGVSFYCGFDPSAASLHVGHLLPLVLMRKLMASGHRPIALVGSATGLIGDPSGKTNERKLLDATTVQENAEGIKQQVLQVLDAPDSAELLVLDNSSWFSELGFVDFLRDIGKHFSVNAMIARDSVKQRLEQREQGISFTEFSYVLLQAYDFYWLNRNYDCRLQIGGSDQWGNITAGLDLIKRLNPPEHPQAFGLTFPLLTTESGQKFGKTEKGTVWLSAERTSPYEFYQFWLNTADADTLHCLRLFTDATNDLLQTLSLSLQTHPEKREAQKYLAAQLTSLVHGSTQLELAKKASAVLFGASLEGIAAETLKAIFKDVPSFEISRSELARGLPILDLLVNAGASSSKGEARRLILGGGCYLNNKKCDSAQATLSQSDLIEGDLLVIRTGKKSFYLGHCTGD